MTNLGGVSVNRPSRQSRLSIQSGQQVPADFRFPGEPEEGRSRQAQSWADAGESFSNWAQMEPFGFFKDIGRGIADLARPAMNWYEQNIYPYTPGARFDPNVERPDSFLTRPIGGSWFRQGPQGAATPGVVPMTGADSGAGAVTQQTAQPTTDWLAQAMAYQNQFAPDYSGMAQGWMDEGNLVNQRLQAMYDQIASRAGENVQRIGDIYGGATAGIGEAYDRSMGSVEDAYASSQQQAADQLARLGIEAAAPTILDPMARSQAEAQALLGAGRASGQAAAQRYGASSGDFASQMAQVAQQEGAQYQTGVADALRRQMMNLQMQAQQEAYQRAMNAPGLAQQLFQASQLGLPQGPNPDDARREAEFLYQQEQDDTNVFRQYYQFYLGDTGGNQGPAREKAYQDAIAGIMGPRIQQRAMSDPNFILQASQ